MPGATRSPAVSVTGLAVATAYGRGLEALADGVYGGKPAFTPVTRFDTGARRVSMAATLPDAGGLLDELAAAIDGACDDAGLSRQQRARTPLLLAWHPDPEAVRAAAVRGEPPGGGSRADSLAARCGLRGALWTYTTACVSSSTAIADACSMIVNQRAERVVVAAGYLVDADYYAVFDAGRALAADGAIRPFSAGRQGLLLGDAIAAVVLEPAGDRGHGRIVGWGRGGDAFHVCQPHPEGRGLARAIHNALNRAGLSASRIGYINAHGTGTPINDSAESAGLHRAFGQDVPPVSSTKSSHGHTLEAAGVLELIVSCLALTTGRLPVNEGYLGPDQECDIDLVLDRPGELAEPYVLSLNAAFGGANTALLMAAP